MTLSVRLRALLILGLGIALMLPAHLARAQDPLVLAAASLKDALNEAAEIWKHRSDGGPVTISYAGSSALAKQIENGSPADIFISADLDWMDYLDKKNLLKPGTRFNWLGNRLVLVAPAGGGSAIDIKRGFPLAQLLHGGKLAIAQPDSVPAGKYGKAALQSLDVWKSVEGQLATAEDVRATLRFVARGEVPLGIVYQTDAAADKSVKIVGTFPEGSYPPIIYPAALLKDGRSAKAAAFLAFLRSSEARPAFTKQGFDVLK